LYFFLIHIYFVLIMLAIGFHLLIKFELPRLELPLHRFFNLDDGVVQLQVYFVD
jgi:hypothetical protein